MERSYIDVNREVWSYLAAHGCDSSQPYGPAEFANARHFLDGREWLPWQTMRSVLCLACGGGQQGPLFAALGYDVTVADFSRAQLERDREVSERHGLRIELVEADMLDLSQLHGRAFDLVYQAISACYIPDVRALYREIFRVLKPGGYYRVEHWNPTHLQLSEHAWDGNAYRISRPFRSGEPIPWVDCNPQTGEPTPTCWHYMHSLQQLIGSLCDEQFAIVRFAEAGEANISAEPGTYLHLAAYLPSFYVLLARRN